MRGVTRLWVAAAAAGWSACGGEGAAKVIDAGPGAVATGGKGELRPDAAPDAAPAALPDPDASPPGASCGQDDECTPGRCVDFRCAAACDADDAHACREVTGLCAVVRNGVIRACVGDVASGSDGDDALLGPGGVASASFASVGDVDVFRLDVPAGRWRVVVTPPADVDLAIDFYDARALPIGACDDGVAGALERASWMATDDLGAFAVVRHVGGATGAYLVRLSGEPVRP